MARIDEQLPTPSNTPSLIVRDDQKPTKVDPYGSPTYNKNRFGVSPRIEGRLLALFGAFLTGLNLTAVQYMFTDKFPAPEALITRYTPPLIFVVIIGLNVKLMCKHTEWYFFARDLQALKILSIRSFIHWASNMCTIYSLLYVPVMITISLFYIWTIFAIFLSHFFLNERADIGDIILSLIGFGGVIMITDPTFQSFNSLGSKHIEGIILIIVSALFYSLNMVILRSKRKSYHWTQTESVAGLWATFVLTPIFILISYYLFDIPMNELMNFHLTTIEWVLFIAISIFAFFAIGGITRALQLETVVIVSIVLYSEVAFGTVFQFVFLHDTTNFDTWGLWIGLGAILVSTFFIMYRKNKQKEKMESNQSFKQSYDTVENNKLHLNKEKMKNGSAKLNLINHAEINKREYYGSVDKTLVV
eukprot:139432_1